eukprot:2759252-Pleurochrysis_carterae.AAC.1
MSARRLRRLAWKPGMVVTPASIAMRFDSILSPIALIAPGPGPTNATPAFSTISAKCAYRRAQNDRYPHRLKSEKQKHI